MKKKRIILLSVIALLIIGAIIAIVAINNKDDKKEEPKTVEKVEKKDTITISFETDGGTEVEALTVYKGSKVTLPTTAKDGFNFLGWYDKEDKKIEDETEFNEDTILKAKWEEIKKDAKTMKVSFDTNGGNKINSITMECGKPLNLPSNPTKAGYKFLNWTDKKGNKVTKETKLTCADTTLYAKWQKEETKKEETKKEETTKTWTCPDGYDIDANHKCTKKVAAKERCEGNRVYEYQGKCVTVTYNVREDTKKSCPKQHVTYMSFAGEVEGKVVNWGVTGCAYYPTNDSSQANCESHGFKWVTPEKTCYVKWISNNTINTCDHLTGYTHLTNPNQFDGVNGLNGGCYPIKDKTKYCEKGTLEGGQCKIQIDATEK